MESNASIVEMIYIYIYIYAGLTCEDICKKRGSDKCLELLVGFREMETRNKYSQIILIFFFFSD